MINFPRTVYDGVLDLVDIVRFNLFETPKAPNLPPKIEIKVVNNKRYGYYWLTSSEYPGLYASGESFHELWENMNDAILTYFDVPRYIAKRRGNTYDLPLPDGRVIVESPRKSYAGA
ncbi:hypothetical protein KKE48_02255 [Patescibacteria group bacterium]|nr:hypothetical protein [Patescibacteria group bacterium]MBU1499666.1 hypothetical protein [Patescibacteria group bacterium]